MPKIPSNHAFFNVNKTLLRELGPYQVIILAYVAEWQAKGLPCFASRKCIAAETGFSEKTVQNSVKSLVDQGYLAVAHHARKRVLTLTNRGGKWYPERGYKIPPEGVRDTQMRGYEILTTNKDITNKDITNINLLSNNTNTNLSRPKTGVVKGEASTTKAKPLSKPLNPHAADWLREMIGFNLEDVPD
jgi:hypothetical protein